MNATPMPAGKALDAFFLEARCRLLDLAAILDRVDRGTDGQQIKADPRLAKIQKAMDALQSDREGRAERIQQIFSLDYDPTWKKPQPR